MPFLRRLSLTALLGFAQLASAVELDPELFPGIEQTSDEALRLAGLAARYPGRVSFEKPELKVLGSDHEAARVELLPRNVTYIRVYRLEETAAVIEEHRADQSLIIDLRYLQSNSLGIDSLGLLSQGPWLSALTAHGSEFEAALQAASSPEVGERQQPAVVLCNRETAGPYEASLAALQAAGAIMAVGERTAGQTGSYSKSGPAWILSAELLANGSSLVGKGFEPRIQIPTTVESNYNCYHLYEAGTDLQQLIRSNDQDQTDTTDDVTAPANEAELDPVLQRGLEIVSALQILN